MKKWLYPENIFSTANSDTKNKNHGYSCPTASFRRVLLYYKKTNKNFNHPVNYLIYINNIS